MDGSEHYVSCIRNEQIYWRHDLTAFACFVSRENINSIFEGAGFGGRIGVLSVDVDGNDYWIWEAITSVDPALVIVEYNGIFGSCEAVTIPYQADFARQNAHYSIFTGEPRFKHFAILRQGNATHGSVVIARAITLTLCVMATLIFSITQRCRRIS
jgi:hypothetical protein